MPIDSKHALYTRYEDRWTRCRDALEGSDAVKGRTTTYLPKLSAQDTQEYDAYLKRALWYGATGRTVQGLCGAIFRKEPSIEMPERLAGLLDNISDDNLDVVSLAQECVTEQLAIGRLGLLVDLPPAGNGEDPYISRYRAEDIINWRTEVRAGKEVLTLVVLQEWVEETDANDAFSVEKVKHFRVLRLLDGVYVQEEWDEKTKLKDITVKRKGRTLDFIPFRFVNATSLSVTPEKPPLLDVVDVNLSHYRTSADLEHGAHFTALPTPWLAGFPVDQTFAIGAGVAFVSDRSDARAGMLEFTGKGLDALRDMRADKERLMAVLGARLLEEQKRAAEAADTVRLRTSGESSALSNVAKTASRALTDCLQWCAWFMGLTGPAQSPTAVEGVSVALNTDFLDDRIDAPTLTALFQALQGGALSTRTWLYNLQRGEILPPGTDIGVELDLIDVEAGTPEAVDNQANTDEERTSDGQKD